MMHSKNMQQFYKQKNSNAMFSTDGIYITHEDDNVFAFSEFGYLKESLSEMMVFMLSQNIISNSVNISEMIYHD